MTEPSTHRASPRPPVHPWAQPLSGALGAAVLMGWVIAAVDSVTLGAGSELARAPVVGALLGLWSVYAGLSGAVGVVLVRGVWGRWRSRPKPPPVELAAPVHAPSGWVPLALLPLGLLALHRAGLRLADRSPETLLLGVLASSLVVASALLWLGAWLASRPVQRGMRVSLVILVWGALWGSLWSAHEDYLGELSRELSWQSLALLAPALAAAVVTVWHVGVPGARQVGVPGARQVGVFGALLMGVLAAAGVLGGLAAGAAGPAEARALRDTSGLLSRPLLSAVFLVGVPTPTLGAEQGLRGCLRGSPLGAPGSVGRVAAGAPDILLITIDGLRFDHTSLDPRSAHPNTPLLLAEAEHAAVFTRAYSPAPSTRAAFRSMFTGLLPGQVDGPSDPRFPWALTLAADQPTLAAYLREAGYETIALVSKPKAFPRDTHALAGFSEVDDLAAEYQLRNQHSAQLKVSRIIGRLAEPPADGRPPRFVWTHLIEPHYPYTHGALADPQPLSGSQEARHDVAVRYIDEQLARLLRFALAPERRDRTVIIITADHGEAFSEHHNARHGASVFNEELHVPLLVFGPSITPGVRTTPVSLVELLPTVLQLAGLEVPVGVCGPGWASDLRGAEALGSRPLYAAALPDDTARYHQLAFVDGDQKLIVDGETGAVARYDLTRDPQEQHPDLSSPATQDLTRRFERFLSEHGLASPISR